MFTVKNSQDLAHLQTEINKLNRNKRKENRLFFEGARPVNGVEKLQITCFN